MSGSRQAPPPSRSHAANNPPAVMSSTAQTPSIAETQEKKEQEIDGKYEHRESHTHNQRETDAARVLQRTYRGHRERRQLAGLSLNPSTRWTEAIKEAQYREITRPRPRSSGLAQETENGRPSEARQNWRRVGGIARRAGGDEQDDDEGKSSGEDAATRKRLNQQKRTQSTQMMDLSYFLEMVDVNHRYGSNLRKYHAEWKRRNTRENFFYWLDHGEGKDLNLENCSRERLDSMKVRYLSREERLNYLTMVDGQGRLCWKKNGIRIDTSVKWKDSAIGIVPVDSTTPTYSDNAAAAGAPTNPSSGSESGESSGDEASKAEKKTTEVPPDAILNRLVRKSSTKSKWIFVADTSFNLYVGIKQSGAFQHSSFLHGSRISSAGLIKIRDGRIKLVQPRSGHYRPPASNFLAFIHTMRAKGVDMSAASVSASYAALIGIEGYMKGKTALKEARSGLKELMSPDENANKARQNVDVCVGEAVENDTKDAKSEPDKSRLNEKVDHAMRPQQYGNEVKDVEIDGRHTGHKHAAKDEMSQQGSVEKSDRDAKNTNPEQTGKQEGLKASLMRKLHIGERKS